MEWISRKRLKASIAQKDDLIKRYCTLIEKTQNQIDSLIDRHINDLERLYPDRPHVKFVHPQLDHYSMAHREAPFVRRVEIGEELESCVKREDIKLNRLVYEDREIHVGYSKDSETWIFCLEEE